MNIIVIPVALSGRRGSPVRFNVEASCTIRNDATGRATELFRRALPY